MQASYSTGRIDALPPAPVSSSVTLTHRGLPYQCLEQATAAYKLRMFEAVTTLPCSEISVVMVHGMAEGWDVWERVLWQLEPRARAFSLDLPWSGTHGDRWAQAHKAGEWVRMGLELVPQPITVLIAHSFGANAVLEYFDRYGLGNVKAVVLISPFYRKTSDAFDWPLLEYYVSKFQYFLELGLLARDGANRLSSELSAAMAEKVRDRVGPLGWLQFFSLFTRTPLLKLDRMQVPFLILGGENDIASFPQDGASLAEALPSATAHILNECGHFCFLEQPQTVLSLLSGFLRQALKITSTENGGE